MHLRRHAQLRMRQRCIRDWQVDYALRYGKRYNRAGAEWRVIRRKDLRPADRETMWAEKLDGLVVCIEHGMVSTVYFTDRPSLHVRRKSKRRICRRTRQ